MDTSRGNGQINWPLIKTRLRDHWTKVTEDDLKQINGNVDQLITILRKRYGYGKAQAEIEINNWLSQQKNVSGGPGK